MKLLSIIVPVYNVENYIVKCISSLLVEGRDDYEILIVNDGTPDKSISLVKSKFNDDRINIVEKENGGLSSARNTGINLANGEYIWFFDSDDWAETSKLREVFDFLKCGADLIYLSSFYRYCEESNCSKVVRNKTSAKTTKELCSSNFSHSACMYLIKKEILVRNGLFFKEGILHEDSLFTPKLITKCKTVICFESPVYYYLDRPGSITNTTIDRRIRDLSQIADELLEFAIISVPKEIKYTWGKCIASIINEMMYLSMQSYSEETDSYVDQFCRDHKQVLSFLFHSGFNNGAMSLLAGIYHGNYYQAYKLLYPLRYNTKL